MSAGGAADTTRRVGRIGAVEHVVVPSLYFIGASGLAAGRYYLEKSMFDAPQRQDAPSERARVVIGGFYLTAIVIFSAVAVMNGYPLVFWDSGSYLRAAIELHYLWNWPVFYSLFVALLHWKLSLWPVIIGQSLITAFVLGEVLTTFAPRSQPWSRIGLVLLLGGATSLPWFTGQIMPDLFAPLLVLTMLVIMVEPDRLSSWRQWALLLVLTLAQSAHYSHITLGAALIGTVLLGGWFCRMPVKLSAVAQAAATTTIAILAIMAVNYVALREVVFAPGAPIVLLSRLMEYETAQDYLARACSSEAYAICAFRDRLPNRFNDFMWDRNGIIRDLGGTDTYSREAAVLVRRVILDAPLRHVTLAIKATAAQFVYFPTGWGLRPYDHDSQIWRMVHHYFAREAATFDNSLQQRGTLPLVLINRFHIPLGYILLIADGVLLGYTMIRKRFRITLFLLVVFISLAINAFLCGALSSSDGRYQSRMMPLMMISLFIAASDLLLAAGRSRTSKAVGKSDR